MPFRHYPLKSRSGGPTTMNLQEHSLLLGDNPYWVFVSFLYAWIAADIAGRFSKAPYHLKDPERGQLRWHSALIRSHLTLASFVVGTSWLAWTQAIANGHVTRPMAVISPQALLLIVDFWILVLYFTLVSVVGDERKSGPSSLLYPYWKDYWKHSSFWVWLILAFYVLWDFLTYFLIPKWTMPSKETYFWAQSWMSAFCTVLAGLAFLWLRRVRVEHPFRVLAADGSLIALILFYRVLKQLMHAGSSQAGTAQVGQLVYDPNECRLYAFGVICFLAFICLGSFAGFVGHQLPLAAPSGDVATPKDRVENTR